MNVALCHFRVGETDGVSLEMAKWKIALENSGHKVIYIAGSEGASSAKIIPSLHYQYPLNTKIVNNAYHSFQDYDSEEELKEDIFCLAKEIEQDLVNCINEHQIDVLVPNNILSLGWHLSAGIAFTKVIKKTGIKTICHHHDFHWERVLYSNPKVDFINDLLVQYFPPTDKHISHVCINKIAKNELKERFNIEANVVPNVFDFLENNLVKNNYNNNLREELNVKNGDILFVQATRVVERKGIELAIDVVTEVIKNKTLLLDSKLYNGKVFNKKNNIYLVFAGKNESANYYTKLCEYAKVKGVPILDISKRVDHERSIVNGEKIYSLWDVYSIADFITYPSILEGWGNQFLEAIVAKLPIVTYKYPVYLSDIEEFGFNMVSLGSTYTKNDDGFVKVSQAVIEDAAKSIFPYLLDSNFRERNTDYNFEKAKENLSLESLQKMLKSIF